MMGPVAIISYRVGVPKACLCKQANGNLTQEKTVKRFALLLAASMLLVASGFSGTQAKPAAPGPSAAAGAENAGSGGSAQQSPQTDAHANGGSALPASMPYTQPNAPVASQNLNAAPFLIFAEPRGAAGAPAQPRSPGLTSRADGTMYGPSDQPAAGTGQGMIAAPEGKGRPAKQAPQKPASGASKR